VAARGLRPRTGRRLSRVRPGARGRRRGVRRGVLEERAEGGALMVGMPSCGDAGPFSRESDSSWAVCTAAHWHATAVGAAAPGGCGQQMNRRGYCAPQARKCRSIDRSMHCHGGGQVPGPAGLRVGGRRHLRGASGAPPYSRRQSGLKYARVGEMVHAAQAEVAKESFWPAPRPLPQSHRTWP
jgi:hypothetical protein